MPAHGPRPRRSRAMPRAAAPVSASCGPRARLAGDRRRGHAALLGRQLRLDDLPVGRAAGEQLGVPPDPGHRAALQHHDLVGVDDGRHPLRDDDHGGLRDHRAQRGSQPRVGGQVQRGERVVEQVDLWAADQRPSDGQPLALPAGDVGAALRDRRLQAVGHRGHEVPALGDLQRGPQLLVGGVRVAVPQVAGHRSGEQVGPLRDQPDPPPQLLRFQVAHVDAVDPDRALAGVEQPGHHGDERGLAGPGAADDGRGLPGGGGQADPPQHRLGRSGIAETDPVEGRAGRRCGPG